MEDYLSIIADIEAKLYKLKSEFERVETENAELRQLLIDVRHGNDLKNMELGEKILYIEDVFSDSNCVFVDYDGLINQSKTKFIGKIRCKLYKKGYVRLDELNKLTYMDLYLMPNTGPETIAIIEIILNHYGYKLIPGGSDKDGHKLPKAFVERIIKKISEIKELIFFYDNKKNKEL